MQGGKVKIYKKIDCNPEEMNTKKKTFSDNKNILYSVFCFLLSRALLMGQLCPFGVAFFAASISKKRMIYGIFGVLIGVFTAGAGLRTLQYAVAVGTVCLFEIIIGGQRSYDKLLVSLFAGVGNFVGSLLIMMFERFVIYDMLVAFLESVIIGLVTYLFRSVYAIEKAEFKKLRIVNREDMFGIIILLGLAVCGLTDFMDFGVVDVSEVIWSLLILSFAYVGGAVGGLCSGVAIGLIAAMSQSDPLNLIGLYGVCGLGSGFAQKGGKIGVASVYLLVAVALGVSTTIFVFGQAGIMNILMAAVIFALIPRRFYEKHFAFDGDFFTPFQKNVYSKRINALLVEKFHGLANAFQGLSDTVEHLSENKTQKFGLNYAKVIDETVEQVCSKCSMCVYCWERESEKTCKSFGRVVSKLKLRGYADVLDFDSTFRAECIAKEELIESINHTFAVQRLNAVWDNQLNETRVLLGEQYKGFAAVMDEMSKDITQKVICESDIKNKIKLIMDASGQCPTEVYLYEREDENYDVELQFSALDEKIRIEDAEQAVSKGMQRRMRVSVIDEYNNFVRFEPQYNFKITSSIATVKKDGETDNGDSYAVFNMRNNRCALVLSDGMGSGSDARKESASAVSLLKKLLMLGFEPEPAIRLVNSALVLKAGRESFATLDVAIVDLLSGTADFIKVGAVRGYIKQKSGVRTIQCNGLPAGILSQTDMVLERTKLEDGDCVILVTDGISEIKTASGALSEFIDQLPRNDTEEMAKRILNYALVNRKGQADDDMTVIVAKIIHNQNTDIV